MPSAAKYFVLNKQVDMTSKIIILLLTSKSKLSSNFPQVATFHSITYAAALLNVKNGSCTYFGGLYLGVWYHLNSL